MSTLTNTRGSTSTRSPNGPGIRSTLGRAPRRLGQWAGAILFVAVVVAGLVALFESQNDRVEVLVVTNPVPAGQVIDDGDVRPADVAGVADAIRAADIDSVLGQRAAAGLVEGQVLTAAALTDEQLPGVGQRLVAIHLPTGRVPNGLAPGDVVDVLAVPVEGAPGTRDELQAPPVLAESASVESVEDTPEGARVVTILLEEAVADAVAAHSAAGQVTIVQAPLSDGEQ